MEDEVITQTPTSDVVEVEQPSIENTTGEMTPAPEVTNVYTPEEAPERVVQNEKTLAETYIDDARANSYLSKGHGVSDWIKNEYNYDQQQAGTMWVAGKINDVATQMSFLEATLNEDMYSELDLQKYFFDTNLATARAYAKEKRHETAYGYYRAAQEKALAEGDLIGWYMPAEANYMLSQWAVANENLKNPDLNTMDRNRAGSVKEAVESWFNSNNITWRGIECLNSLYLKETIRHNKENERLQDDANQIAKAQNAANRAASGAGYDLQLRTLEFQIAENELDMGVDLDLNGTIGHTNVDISGNYTGDADRFGWYPDMKTWAQHNLEAAFNYWGTSEMHTILGDDYNKSYNFYRSSIDNKRLQSIYAETNSQIVAKENMNTFGNNKFKVGEQVLVQDEGDNSCYYLTTSSDNNQIYIHYNSDGSARLYLFDKNGVAHQIVSGIADLSTDTTLNALMDEHGLRIDNSENPIYIKDSNGNMVQMHIGTQRADLYQGSLTNNPERYSNSTFSISSKSQETIISKEADGYVLLDGAISTQGANSPWVMELDGKYYEVSELKGEWKEIKAKDVMQGTIDSDGQLKFTDLNGNKVSDLKGTSNTDYFRDHFEKIGYSNNGEAVYRYRNPDGSAVYVEGYGNLNYFKWDTPKFKVLSENDVIDQGILTKEQINTSNTENYNYIHRIDRTPAIANVKSSDEIIDDTHEELSAATKKKTENEMKKSIASSGGGSSNGPRKVEQSQSAKQNSDKVETHQEDAVIVDSANVADANLGEQAQKEIEENKKRYEKLFNLS